MSDELDLLEEVLEEEAEAETGLRTEA